MLLPDQPRSLSCCWHFGHISLFQSVPRGHTATHWCPHVLHSASPWNQGNRSSTRCRGVISLYLAIGNSEMNWGAEPPDLTEEPQGCRCRRPVALSHAHACQRGE